MKITQFIYFIITATILLNISYPYRLVANEEAREITSFGVSKKEAVANALIEAIQQVKGVKISGAEAIHSFVMEEDLTKKGVNEFTSSMQNSQAQDVLKQFQGVISSYEVINISEGLNGRGWEATVKVFVPVYKTPGISPHSRRKLAVIPFRTTKASYDFRGSQLASSEISRQFTQKLVTEITQTRKFTVLDREYMEEFLQEKNLVLSANAPTSEQMKIGEVLGVDYLVIGTVTDASLQRSAYKIPQLEETGYKDQATFIADYRIVVMATRQIKWSDSIALTLRTKELKKLVPNRNPQLIQQAVLNRAAEMIAQKAMENIFPIRVAQLQGNGQLILNQGGTTVDPGDLMDVYSPGKKVKDQYTGESLGAAESWVATLEIVRVIPKMSYAKIVNGAAGSVLEGYICRRASVGDTNSHLGAIVQKEEKKLVPKW